MYAIQVLSYSITFAFLDLLSLKLFFSFTATDNDAANFGDRVLTVFAFKHDKIVVATHIDKNYNKHWYSEKIG